MLRRLLAGELGLEEAEVELRRLQLLELDGDARLDVGRLHRRGLPEVILAQGKSPLETAQLAVSLALEQGQGLASRLSEAHRAALLEEASRRQVEVSIRRSSARVSRPGFEPPSAGGRVAVLTAGTSDLDVAEEARLVVQACGHECRIEADLGVAGLHRLLGPLAEVVAWRADAIIVAAGMDGVLPGVVTALVGVPVIGVPVSTGYGAGGGGRAALHTMLQSCSTGLVVVNIDNGVGAGAAASLIASAAGAARRPPPGPGKPESAPRPRLRQRGSDSA